MAVTGWRSPGTISQNTTGSTASFDNIATNPIILDWSSGSNISPRLLLTNFGFSAEIAGAASIDGIEFRYDRSEDSLTDNITTSEIYIINSSGAVLTGTNNTEGGEWDRTSDNSMVTVTVGGASNLMGYSGVVYADVIDSDFGVALRVTADGTTPDGQLGNFQVRIHYTEGSANDELAVPTIGSGSSQAAISLDPAGNDSFTVAAIASGASLATIGTSIQGNTEFVAPALASSSSLSAITVDAQDNDSFVVPLIETTAVPQTPTFNAADNESLVLASITNVPTLQALTLDPQDNTSFALPPVTSGAVLQAVTIQEQANPSIAVPVITSGVAFQTPVFNPAVNEDLAVASISSGATLSAITIDAQENDSLPLALIAASSVLAAIMIAVTTDSIAVPTIESAATLAAPELSPAANESLDVTPIGSSATLASLTISGQGNDSFAIVSLTNGAAPTTVSIQAQINTDFVLPAITSTATLTAINLYTDPAPYDVTRLNVDVAHPGRFPGIIRESQFDNEDHALEIFTSMQSNGGDIRLFADAELTIPIPLELVEVDTTPASEKLIIFFRTPDAGLAVDDGIWVRTTPAGGETAPAADSTYGSEAVWVDYILVSHDGVTDSTGNFIISNTGGAVVTTGLYNGFPARGYDTTYGVSSTDKSSFNWTGNPAVVTFSAIAYDASPGSVSNGRIFEQNGGSTFKLNTDSNLSSFTIERLHSSGNAVWTANHPGFNSWGHIALVLDSSNAANDPTVYDEGVDLGLVTDSNQAGAVLSGAATSWVFGNRNDGARPFDGMLGGIRFRDDEVTAAWLVLEAACYGSPDSLLSAGALEATVVSAITLPVIPSGASLEAITVDVQDNESIVVSAITAGSTVAVIAPAIQDDEALALPTINSTAALEAVTIQDAGNVSIALSTIPSGSVLYEIDVAIDDNESLALAAIPSGAVLEEILIQDIALLFLEVPTIASTAVLQNLTVEGANNESVALPAIASGSTINVITVQIDEDEMLVVPPIAAGTIVQSIVIQSDPNEEINVNAIPSGSALQNLTLDLQDNESLVLAAIPSGSALAAIGLDPEDNESLVAPWIVSGSTLAAIDLESPSFITFPTIPSGAIVPPLMLVLPGNTMFKAPAIPSRKILNAPQLRDAVSGGGLGNLELNPFPPNIPTELEAILPPEAGQFLQNLTETLHGVYDQLQAGSISFPAQLLQFVDVTERFTLGTIAQFLHQEYGFIRAQYVQFYEDGTLGAPVGISRFDPEKVTTVKANARSGSGVGFAAGLARPRKDYFGWVVIDGQNLTPVITESALSEGDEVGWSDDGKIATALPGRVIGRYFGPTVEADTSLPRGVIKIRVESSTGNSLISEIDGVVARIESLNVVDGALAQSIASLLVSVNQAVATISDEKTVRINSDKALAQRIGQLGVDIESRINASFITATQAAADADAAVLSHVEEARAEFRDALEPVQQSAASALSQLDLLSTGLQASVDQVTTIHVQLFGTEEDDVAAVGIIESLSADIVTNAGGVSANASAITALDVRLSSAETGLSAASSAISSLEGRVTTNEGDISTQGAAITAVNSRVDTAESDITATASVVSTHSTQISTQDGLIATINAQWGVTVDVNNRVTGMVKLSADETESSFDILADNFRVYNGTTDVPAFAAIGGIVYLSGIPLRSNVQAQEGSNLRPIGVGFAQGFAKHGVPITFSQVWSSPPIILFGAGGKIYNSAYGDSQEHVYRANSVTGSGFTPSLKIQDPVGVVTNVVDNTVTPGPGPAGGQPEEVIEKSASLGSATDTYEFKYSCDTLPAGGAEPAEVTLLTRTTIGGAWTARSFRVHSSIGVFTADVSVPSLGADAAFGILFEQSTGSFIQVAYSTNTGVSSVSATPSPISGVPYIVIGNPAGV